MLLCSNGTSRSSKRGKSNRIRNVEKEKTEEKEN